MVGGAVEGGLQLVDSRCRKFVVQVALQILANGPFDVALCIPPAVQAMPDSRRVFLMGMSSEGALGCM